MFADVRSNIWIGTADAGLDMYDPYNGVFKNYTHDPALQSSLSIGVVTCFFEDRSGALWIGTTNGGINRIDWKQQNFFNITHIANDPASLNRSTILALCEDRTGALWVGTAGGGLSRRLFGQNKFEHYLQLPHEFISNTITAVYEDRQGTIWIGTDPGVGTSAGTVMMFDRKLNTFKPRTDISPGVAGIGVFYEDNRGELWIGTNFDGVRRLDPQRKEVITYKYDKHNSNSISGNRVMTICEDNKGILWFGTYGSGLNRYDPATDRFTCYRNDPLDPNSLSNNAVWCIVADSNGYLWMGTWGGGLNKFLPEEESFQRFTINDGLPSNVVVGILADNAGNLWLSTNNGLCKFNTSTYACKNYDRSDGLQSDEFIQGAYCTGKDGRLYFGGTNGITAFYPDSIKNNPNVPPIVLTKFSVFDKQLSLSQPINLTREITLSYQQNFFSFEFAALDYTAPEKNQYTHKLEGIDEDWVYRGNRNFASYTDIAPGKYVFRVKGSNNDGVWSKKDAVVSIIITPPFWLTWWFKAIVVLLILNVLYAIHRYRVNKLLAVERTRVRIAKDLHDEVSATITGISYFSDAISKEVGSNKTPMLQKLFSLVKESVDQVQESMSDIIWSINPENDRWETILPKFRRYASDLCESKNIKYEISIPASIPGKDLSMEKRHNFWLIFKEMVTNAVKHSGCSEMIIAITSDNKQLILNIKDNGKGFDPEKPTDRNGVKNIKSRSAATGGKVELNTIPGKGTEWKLVIQL
ncbi:MAG TPA: hypothetical protein ENH47_03435 [Ignavibacteriales bacterium]|nr:hypothetical protein [Ignavibacteriales bacterium]